jgi:rhamnulokinase
VQPDAAPPTRHLAFDLGASTGRAMLGELEGGRVTLRELHRFPTPLVERGGHLFWELAALWAEIEQGLGAALREAPDLRSVSVDSWAVDYVPVDAAGDALRDPYAYRDPRTQGRMQQALALVPAEELYRRTGIQMQPFNTLYQLLDDVDREPEVVGRTAHRLTIADYLLFRLSGRAAVERSMASTTQLMDVGTGGWAMDLVRRLGLPEGGWPEIVPAGTVLGPLLAPGPEAGAPLVVATCSHDTGAAVAGVPAETGGAGWAYLSTGTWSLLGVERDAPILSEAARAANFTNEAGLDGTVRFLKNLMGMWILQECEREWRADGAPLDYPALVADAASAAPAAGLLDVNDPRFAARGGMLEKISAHCRERSIPEPGTRPALVRLLLESLAADYARAVAELERLTGERVEVIHLVGGAARNALLCQVLAGPTEATAMGNVLMQARALGELPPGLSIRDVVRASSDLREHRPHSGSAGARPDAGMPPTSTVEPV